MLPRRSLFALLSLCVAGCDWIVPPLPTPPQLSNDSLPPLESISFDLLGHSKIVFERLSTFQTEAGGVIPQGGLYVIDAAARRTYPLLDYRKLYGAGPALSPDGSSVVFTAYSNDYPCCGRQLYAMNVDGTNLRRVGSHSDGETFAPSWWPGGSEVLARVTGKPGTTFYRQAPSPSAAPSLVVQIDSTADSSWSFVGQVSIANGRMLVSASRQSKSPPTIVWQGLPPTTTVWRGVVSMNLDGTGLAPFRAGSDQSPIFAPTWSPDGRRIAFLRGYRDAVDWWSTSVVVANADGSNEQVLTTVGAAGPDAYGYVGSPNAFSLCWLSNGSNIIFSAPLTQGLWHLFVVTTDLSINPRARVHQLTTDLGAQDTSVSCSG
jgi:WD40 repeat protein